MLASLLPGLREVRTPLAVGYLWFFNFWLWFGDDLPRRASDTDSPVVQQVFELSDLLGTGITVAAISFAAYIFGSLVMFPFHASRAMAELSDYIPLESFIRDHLSKLHSLLVRMSNVGGKIFIGTMSPITGSTMASANQAAKDLSEKLGTAFPIRAVLRNRYDLRTRLMVADKELFGEYDRLTAESQFRINVALPLALGLATLLITTNVGAWWLWPLGFAAIVVLLFQGFARDVDAVTVLMRSLIVEKITTPHITENLSKGDDVGDKPAQTPSK